MKFLHYTWLVLPLVFCGCSSNDDGREGLSGTVQFQGKPLARGNIEFAAKDGSSQTGAPIQDGEFTIPATKGLPPGNFTVRIYSASEAEATDPGPPGPESMKQVAKELIPAEFNVNSRLTCNVEQGGDNVFNFDIP